MDAFVDNRTTADAGLLAHWGLAEPPFVSLCDPRWFYQSGPHEEAIARLTFAFENRRRLAVLNGSRGTGKSLTLAVVAHTIRRTGGDVCLFDLAGRTGDDFAWSLAAGLKLGLSVDTPMSLVWRRIDEHLDGRRDAHLPVTLLCDHFGSCEQSTISAIERLLRSEELGRSLTVIIAGRPGELPSSFQDLADLRVHLEPLDLRETHGYVTGLLEAAGATRAIFDHEALDELHALSGGLPREINRIAELALLAGQCDGAERISESLLRNAAAEARVERLRRRPTRELVAG